jgi:protein-S-isoprenylcysteine O-methyltransferase Ste14
MKTRYHENRNDLAGEHKLGDAGQIVLALLFAAVWILDTFFLNFSVGLNALVPLWPRVVLGIAFTAVSGIMAKRGLHIVFGEKREKLEVIRKDVFGLVRHPVYLSEILLYLGFLMFSLSLTAAAVWVVAIGFLHYIARDEERLLLERLGKDYRQYMAEVPMWIPRLKRERDPLT